MTKIGISDFLRTLAPNFCWCDYMDLLMMYEQIDEDVNVDSFTRTLYKMVGIGIFERKKFGNRSLFRRISK